MTQATATVPPDAGVCAPPPCGKHGFSGRLLSAGLIALFVAVGYAQTLGFGRWLDDHPHFLHLRDRGWTYRDAVEQSFLAIPGEVADCWGRTEPPIRFYRPVAFTLMKIQYLIGRWRPDVMHGFSLLWHLFVCLLVASLATRFFGNRAWGTVAGCLMAIHPAHIGTVAWIACQTELMTTTFQLAAILAYATHARWGERFFYPDMLPYRGHRPWLTGRLSANAPCPSLPALPAEPPFTPAIAVCLSFFLLALGCRENAVMLPVVCWLGDRFLGAGRRKWIRWEHVAMAAMVVVYIAVRHLSLGQTGAPTWAELMDLTRGSFAFFLVEKTALYVLGIFCYVPTIPVISSQYIDRHPAVFYATLVSLLAFFFVMRRWAGRGPAIIWAMLAVFILMAPTIPIYPSAHHLYLPSIGGVLLITSFMALVGGAARTTPQPLGRFRTAMLVLMIALHAAGLSAVTRWRLYLYQTATMTEDLAVDDVIRRSPRPVKSGDHLFLLNLPVMAYYAPCAVRLDMGLTSLQGHVLMYSPYVSRMEAPSELQVVDSHRLLLKAPTNQPYLGGISGQTIRKALKLPELKTGTSIETDLYNVNILRADERGVYEVEYLFKKPLDSPEYHFYFGSPQFMAYPVDVSRPTASAAGDTRATGFYTTGEAP